MLLKTKEVSEIWWFVSLCLKHVFVRPSVYKIEIRISGLIYDSIAPFNMTNSRRSPYFYVDCSELCFGGGPWRVEGPGLTEISWVYQNAWFKRRKSSLAVVIWRAIILFNFVGNWTRSLIRPNHRLVSLPRIYWWALYSLGSRSSSSGIGWCFCCSSGGAFSTRQGHETNPIGLPLFPIKTKPWSQVEDTPCDKFGSFFIVVNSPLRT